MQSHDGPSSSKAKRTTACLNCRRQKFKCDAAKSKPCSRCKAADIECIIRPRTNAAVLVDDLRWQQSVEARFQLIERRLDLLQTPIAPIHFDKAPSAVPVHLETLRDALVEPLRFLQGSQPLDVTPEEAATLWDHFYSSLAIYHGFAAPLHITPPSPVLLASIGAAAARRPRHPRLDAWNELFDRSLLHLLRGEASKTFDDAVGLCIARTWFWSPSNSMMGLIYGTFIDALRTSPFDQRSRKVWDFVHMTAFTLTHHGHILPDRPPPQIPPRVQSNVLFSTLAELSDILAVLARALTPSGTHGLSEHLLVSPAGARTKTWSFAEEVVLHNCVTEIERWGQKWLSAVNATDTALLPAGKSKSFLLNLVAVYYRCAMVIVHGYIQQGSDQPVSAYQDSSKELLALVVDAYGEAVCFWPTTLLNASLLATMVLLPDDLSQRAFRILDPLVSLFDSTGVAIHSTLKQKLQSASDLPLPVQEPQPSGAASNDVFWNDLLGVLQVPAVVDGYVPISELNWEGLA